MSLQSDVYDAFTSLGDIATTVVITRKSPGAYSASAGANAIGTITTGLTTKAATAVSAGVSSVVCTTAPTTGKCALLAGDYINFAGDSQDYKLTANATQASANSNVTLQFTPALKVALAGGEAVTVKGTTTTSGIGYLDGSSIKTLGYKFGENVVTTGDELLYLATYGLDFEPAIGDSVAVAGSNFTVIAGRPTRDGSTVVLWELLVRR